MLDEVRSYLVPMPCQNVVGLAHPLLRLEDQLKRSIERGVFPLKLRLLTQGPKRIFYRDRKWQLQP
jgi:hypothetical protein